MRLNRIAVTIAVMMFAASVGAIVARPPEKATNLARAISLDGMVPKRFGDWREVPGGPLQVVNPQTQQLLDKIYSQILSRVYVNEDGYRIMLSIAYGSDQRGSLQVHKPEACYPAQGFTIRENHAAMLLTAFGKIPVRRLFAVKGERYEPLTYWFTVGDEAVRSKLQKRLVALRYGLTGRIPDGLLFRASSIDFDRKHAYQLQNQFINQLLDAVSPEARMRLSGLGAS